MPGDALEVIETRLLKPYKYPRIVHNGYLYHFHKPCCQHLRWKCNRVYSMKCPAVLRTNMDMLNLEYIAIDHEHVHESDDIAISDLRSKIKIHRASSSFQNNSMFKPREGYVNIRIDPKRLPKNNTRIKPKNGYAKVNTVEEDIPEDIKNNTLARFCASMNQIYFIDPLDPDHEHRYTDECKKRRKKKKFKNSSFNFECPNIRITRNTTKQKQIEFNNSKDYITENTKKSPPFNDKNKTFDQTHEEISLKEQNLTVNKKKEDDGQMNESTLNTIVDKEKNNLFTHTTKIINNKTINTHKEKSSSISDTNKDNNTLTNNIHEEINTLTNNNTHTCKEEKSLISNINKNKNTLTGNMIKKKYKLTRHNRKQKNTLTSNINKTKYLLNRHKLKKKNTLTTNTKKKKSSLINNLNKKKYILTRNNYKKKNSLTTNTINTKKYINTTGKQKSSFTTNDRKKMIPSKLKKNNLKLTKQNSLEMKDTSVIIAPTIQNTPTTLPPKIKSCMNKTINNEDDKIVSNDNDDTGHHDEEHNNITDDVNDHLISIYRKENWSTILKKLNDPLTGIEVFKSILFYKAYAHAMRQHAITKSNIQKIKNRTLKWKAKFECLAFEMKTLLEHTKSDRNTKHISIQQQNQADTILCKNIGVGAKENKAEIQKKVSTNQITPENFKTSKLYQQSLNSENRNLTESDTNIKTTKSKEIKMNKASTPVMIDFINDIPSSSTVSMLSPESLKSKKRNLTKSDPCISSVKTKILKTKHSSIPSFDNLDPPDTTVLNINSNSFYSKQNNLSQTDSVIKMTQSKMIESNLQSDKSIKLSKFLINECKPASTNLKKFDLSVDSSQSQDTTVSRISPNFTQCNTDFEMIKSKYVESNKHSISVSTNISPNTPISTQYDSEIEICEVTESDMIDYYEPFMSDSTDSTVNYQPVITTLGLSSNSPSNQETILAQYNTDIMNTNSQLMESTPAYIDLTVDSPPDLTASSVNSNMFDGQLYLTQHNTQIECYEPSTAASFALSVNNLPVMTNSRINNESNIFTEYNEGIKIMSSTSMSTDLSRNIPTFSSSSLNESSPLNHDSDLDMLDQPIIDVLVVEKDAQLSTINSNRMKRLDWKSPNNLMVIPKKVPIMTSRERAVLPVAIKRLKGSKPKVNTSPQYPLLNKLLTKQIKKVKSISVPDKINFISNAPVLSVINQMKVNSQPTNTTLELDQRNMSNTPIIHINNRMTAPLPDVVYESTQITNEINYQETIQSNYSYNILNAPHQIKPVPIAIPLPPSEIIYDYSDEV